jgi:hypothetical protein
LQVPVDVRLAICLPFFVSGTAASVSGQYKGSSHGLTY